MPRLASGVHNMQTKKMRPDQSATFKNNRRHYTTVLTYFAAVMAWAYAMAYLQADNVTQRQLSAPVAVVQEVASHE